MRSLMWFPRSWRLRYGGELVALMEKLDESGRSSFSTRFDLARAGLAERFRILAPGALPPQRRALEGALLVLYAWMLFVIGGVGVAKVSEHWQAVTPATAQSVSARAFSVLYWSAGLGSVFVLAGVAITLPAVLALLRRGDFRTIGRPILRAVLLTALAVVATFLLARWAHSLTPAKRNGSDTLYSGAFGLWIILVATCLFAWAAAAAEIARHVELSRLTLRLEGLFAAAVGVAMVVMAVASAIWWGSLADVAPWFFSGRPYGSSGSVVPPNMIAAATLIVVATTLGLIGAQRSVRDGLLANRR